MKRSNAIIFFSAWVLLSIALVSSALSDSSENKSDSSPMGEDIQTPAPPLSEDYFPCVTCHELGAKFNSERRELKEDHKDMVFDHDSKNRWCLDCHAGLDRNKLHLASGELIEFGQSYRLCGQCHGPTYRDWRAGVHGKRTGMWNGKKNYFLCVHCHDPHSPAIKPLKPFPAPMPPEGKPFILGVHKK
jgi:uncharacterized CHY-type Zn-finger protein